jgi:hypothetical protein
VPVHDSQSRSIPVGAPRYQAPAREIRPFPGDQKVSVFPIRSIYADGGSECFLNSRKLPREKAFLFSYCLLRVLSSMRGWRGGTEPIRRSSIKWRIAHGPSLNLALNPFNGSSPAIASDSLSHRVTKPFCSFSKTKELYRANTLQFHFIWTERVHIVDRLFLPSYKSDADLGSAANLNQYGNAPYCKVWENGF